MDNNQVNLATNEKSNSELIMHVVYKVKAGKRDEFIKRVTEAGIIKATKQEPGNLLYDYYCPIDDNNSVLLVEEWTDTNAQEAHCRTEHFKRLSEIKKEYVEEIIIKKFDASDIL